ncbi:hypothetical protein [Paenibacillus sp. GbtcB18]|uniref:hypothetical protein n=1 Tax=Paenibacillus sp. GbtcB18 TaxID=2824763 RepID=UPI001C2FBA3F|nr:hypothetical protein [Paenibacillus sp. GbtcB18]
MKKLFLSMLVIFTLALSSGAANAATTEEVSTQVIQYDHAFYRMGETYQMGYGKGYTYEVYIIREGISVSKTGLVTALKSGGGGSVQVYDRFGNWLEDAFFYNNY